MSRILRFALTLIAFLISQNASAAKPKKKLAVAEQPSAYQNKPPVPGGTLWLCAYDRSLHIDCELADASSVSKPVQIDQRLPRIVHDIRNAPEALTDTIISIPLHNIPFDMEFTGELVESVLCTAKAACSILFGEDRQHLVSVMSQFLGTPMASLAR